MEMKKRLEVFLCHNNLIIRWHHDPGTVPVLPQAGSR
jgi:hypothetical protein